MDVLRCYRNGNVIGGLVWIMAKLVGKILVFTNKTLLSDKIMEKKTESQQISELDYL